MYILLHFNSGDSLL